MGIYFFLSGLLLGAIFPLVLIIGAKNGYKAATQQFKTIHSKCSVTAFIVFMSYFGQSFTSNLLHERYGALILGIVVGTMFIYERRENRIREETKKLKNYHNDRLQTFHSRNGWPSRDACAISLSEKAEIIRRFR